MNTSKKSTTGIYQKFNLLKNKIRDGLKLQLGISIVIPIVVTILWSISIPDSNTKSDFFTTLQNNLITVFSGSLALFSIIFALIQIRKGDEDLFSWLIPSTTIFHFLFFFSGAIASVMSIQLFTKTNQLLWWEVYLTLLFVSELLWILVILYKIYNFLNPQVLLDDLLKIFTQSAYRKENTAKFEYFLPILNKRLFDYLLVGDKIKYDKILNVYYENFCSLNEFSNKISIKNQFYELITKYSGLGIEFKYNHFRKFLIFFIDISFRKNDIKLFYEVKDLFIGYMKDFQNYIEFEENLKYYLIELRLPIQYLTTVKNPSKENEISELFIIEIIGNINNTLKLVLESNKLNLIEIGVASILSSRNYFKQNNHHFTDCTKDIDLISMFDNVILGLYSWSIYLFENKQISNECLLSMTKQIHENFDININCYFFKIANSVLNENHIYFWDFWNFKRKNQHDLIYYLPTKSDWFSYGLVLLFAYKTELSKSFSYNQFEIEDLVHRLPFILESVNNATEKLTNDNNASLVNLLLNGLDVSETKVKEFSVGFNTVNKEIRKIHEEKKQEQIACLLLSQNKVSEFVNFFKNEFVENLKLKSILHSYKSITLYSNDLTYSNQQFLQNKIALEKEYFVYFEICSKIPSLSWMNFISNDIENRLIESLNSSTNISVGNLKLDDLDKAIIQLKTKGHHPDIILIDHSLFGQYIFNKSKSVTLLIENNKEQNIFSYNGCKTIPLHFISITNRIIVLDSNRTFQCLTNENYSETNYLDIIINEEEKNIDDNIDDLTTEKSKTTKRVNVEIALNFYYKIKDENAYICIDCSKTTQ